MSFGAVPVGSSAFGAGLVISGNLIALDATCTSVSNADALMSLQVALLAEARSVSTAFANMEIDTPGLIAMDATCTSVSGAEAEIQRLMALSATSTSRSNAFIIYDDTVKKKFTGNIIVFAYSGTITPQAFSGTLVRQDFSGNIEVD